MNPYLRKNSNFGYDEIACILSKLPVESLQHFKIVHKSWCSIINDPNFIKMQIKESSSNVHNKNTLNFIENNSISYMNSQVVPLQPPNFHMSQDVSYPLVSSCNGLLYMVYSLKIFIWNPTIRKYKIVKNLNHLKRVKRYESTLYGFAYDSISDDYKIIATFVFNAKDSCHIVGIYSVKNQSWKKIDTIPAGYRLFDQNAVSFDGTRLTLMATRSLKGKGGSDFNEFFIISLIRADEKFIVTPVPSQYCGSQMKMSIFSNRLYLSGFVEMDFLVCSREKDGEWWTWTSVMKIPTLGSLIGLGNHNFYLDDIIFLKKNENILWRKMDGGFLEYDVRKKK
ncbi:hypothetical protein R3W88_031950 [Solanum pinnatisectum]|uniref:Uncharacterized protein n=1 Tax=Solanum pinnatisectum TaxID=50273 RepID=A0AAV9LNT3_9SOLN|nr:hypothetical protein R3W88_031950 [Solanum pinnatisectum]